MLCTHIKKPLLGHSTLFLRRFSLHNIGLLVAIAGCCSQRFLLYQKVIQLATFIVKIYPKNYNSAFSVVLLRSDLHLKLINEKCVIEKHCLMAMTRQKTSTERGAHCKGKWKTRWIYFETKVSHDLEAVRETWRPPGKLPGKLHGALEINT